MLNTLFHHLLERVAHYLTRKGHFWLATFLFGAAENTQSYAYAKALWTDGRLQEARQALEDLLTIEPSNADAHNLLGVMQLEAGELVEAEKCFCSALRLNSRHAIAQVNLGNIHIQRNETEQAINCYRRALEIDPQLVEALTNLGGALNHAGQQEEAERISRRAITIAPNYAGAYCNLGNILRSQGRTGEAISAYRQALALQPSLPEAIINLSLTVEDPGLLVNVIDYYQKKLEQYPQDIQSHLRLAQAYQALEQWDKAREYLFQALAIDPLATDALALMGKNYARIGDIQAGLAYYLKVLQKGPHAGAHGNLAFDLQYLPDVTANKIRTEFEVLARLYVHEVAQHTNTERNTSDRQIRVGYVSGDFCRHSVAFFVEPILKCHDRTRFSIYCYSTLLQSDAITNRFRKLADFWRDVSLLSTDDMVKQIERDQIDILVDLSGHTYGNRLHVFARKPAPIQVTMIGQPSSTGLSSIDWRIGDYITDPPGLTESHYTERLCRLPDCFLAYHPQEDSPSVLPPPCEKNGYITFGNFNFGGKTNAQTVAVWSQILQQVPQSRFVLKSFSFSSQEAKQRLTAMFVACGISPERLELLAWEPESCHHLDKYSLVDIALDPFPYNGTTTTCEALWMGVPVVCLVGDRHASRVGASLLTCLGLKDLLGDTEDAYIRIAVELAHCHEKLHLLRMSLRDRMKNSPLLNHAHYVRTLEAAYLGMIDAPSTPPAPPVEPDVISLSLASLVQIQVPDTLGVISRFVIEERGDWFESEIGFVRRFLRPGMQVLDVGANYGVYALSAAAAIGSGGRVWAFEPDPRVARLLRESVALNGFDQLAVIERAVADAEGTALLDISGDSELNHLVDSGEGLSVALTTLDVCRTEFGFGTIDFVKIDAEGQEPAVVRGSQMLLTSDMPLVMAEFKHGTELNTSMFEEFVRLGFSPYALVPGPGLLVPYNRDKAPDAFLLNLFFCTDVRAAQLEERGLLCRDPLTSETLPVSVDEVLDCHARALRINLPPDVRLAALGAALNGAERLASAPQAILGDRLNLARILADSGQQQRACIEYENILACLHRGEYSTIDLSNCLLPPGEQSILTEEVDVTAWLIAATADWLYSNTAFSAFFAPADCMQLLNAILATPYRHEKAQRLKRLILRRWYGDSLLVNGELEHLIGSTGK